MNNFDSVASFYDLLAKLVYGNAIRKAQTYFLTAIPENAHILVLGGGTGWILPEILQKVPGCMITYVEASAKMLQKSREKVDGDHPQILFIHGTEKDLPVQHSFDVIMTPFVLDLFSDATLSIMMNRLADRLSPEGLWHFTDFTGKDKWWQKLLLKGMYLFFSWTTSIEARQSPDWETAFDHIGMEKQKEQSFYGSMIKTVLYGYKRYQ